jgi:hypothetical protein
MDKKESYYSKARILTMIPVIVMAVTVICLALATILEGPTDRGTLYSIFAFVGIVIIFLSPLPCLVISVIGTVFASKAKKEGMEEARKYYILGIIETLVYIMGATIAIMMFIGGQGV